MIFRDFLENLFGDRIKVRALRCLVLNHEGLTGRGLASLVGTSHFKMNQVLGDLTGFGIVRMIQAGRANLYRLNEDHITCEKFVLPAFRFEAHLLEDLGQQILLRLDPRPLSVILYGSVARREEGSRSDLDLLLLYEGGTSPGSIIETGDLLSEWISRTYGNPVSLRRSSIQDFQKRARSKDPLIRNIIREGRVLTGLSTSEVLDYGRKKN